MSDKTTTETIVGEVQDVKDKTKKKLNFRVKPKLPSKKTLKTIGLTALVTTVAIGTAQSRTKKTLTVEANTSDIVDDSESQD